MSLDKFISTQGYKANSPDRNNPYNVIPSNKITMQNVPHPVYGIDNYGQAQMMMPGGEYEFGGDYVTEFPMHQMPDGSMMPGETHGDYEEMELTDDQIAEYRAGGYVVEELQTGGEYTEEVDGIPVKRVYTTDFHGDKQFALVDEYGNELSYGVESSKPKMEGPDTLPIPKGLRPKFDERKDSLDVYTAGLDASSFYDKAVKSGTMFPGSDVANEYARKHGKFKDIAKDRFGTNPDIESFKSYKPADNKRPYTKPIEKIQPKGLHVTDTMPTIHTSPMPGVPNLPEPTITGYTQSWNPVLNKWEQEPQYQVIAEPAVRKQDGGAYEEVDLTDEQIAAYRAKGIRVDVL